MLTKSAQYTDKSLIDDLVSKPNKTEKDYKHINILRDKLRELKNG